MARILLPAAVATTALLLAAGLVLTKYTAPIEGAASEPALYNLIARAVHDSELTPGPHPGQSSLSITRVPALTDSLRDTVSGQDSADSSGGSSPVALWARAAAEADSAALHDWLGRWVVATSITAGDTVRITLRRFSSRAGCPWVSTLVAKTAGVLHGEYHLVNVAATCPLLQKPATVETP
jgi:hypothetical protein